MYIFVLFRETTKLDFFLNINNINPKQPGIF